MCVSDRSQRLVRPRCGWSGHPVPVAVHFARPDLITVLVWDIKIYQIRPENSCGYNNVINHQINWEWWFIPTFYGDERGVVYDIVIPTLVTTIAPRKSADLAQKGWIRLDCKGGTAAALDAFGCWRAMHSSMGEILILIGYCLEVSSSWWMIFILCCWNLLDSFIMFVFII